MSPPFYFIFKKLINFDLHLLGIVLTKGNCNPEMPLDRGWPNPQLTGSMCPALNNFTAHEIHPIFF